MGHKYRRRRVPKLKRVDPDIAGTPYEGSTYISILSPDGSHIDFTSRDVKVDIASDYIDATVFGAMDKTYVVSKRKFTITGTAD